MCGIFGIVKDNSSEQINKDRVKSAAQLMRHRGPDAYGQWGADNHIELAHVRLSIIDLSPENNQPFFSSCGNYVIVFNGEIYNYLEIKTELQKSNYIFRTAGDTEVLLNSYIEWGEKCVEKFNGDWAFAIYNLQDKTLFCSRDRFGVKPFNYAVVNDCFMFSSEIKAIIDYFPQLKIPSYNVIANYCRNSLGAQIEETWFDQILRLLPAHNLLWKNGKITIKRYWDYPKQTLKNVNFHDAEKQYRDLFINAVNIRMRSDVPVGSTLSSGLDSSSIVSVIREFSNDEHHTFTAVFPNEEFGLLEKNFYATNLVMDEGKLVTKLASELNLTSHLIPIKSADFCKELAEVIYFLESGHSSPATVPLAKIIKVAKKYVSVIMEGQGADELLSGYVTNGFPSLVIELLKRGRFRQARREIIEFKKTYSTFNSVKTFIRLLNLDFFERFYHSVTRMDRVFGPRLYKYHRIKDYPFAPEGFDEYFNKELFKLHTGVLVNLLHYGDAISLSHSIESRLPFMDVNLVEFSFKLPYNFKMYNGLGKYIHRRAMENIVPQSILKNPVKFGFNTPISLHFNSMDSEANTLLLSDICTNRGIFDKKELVKFIKEHISGKKNNSNILFRFLSVELWFRQFIDQGSRIGLGNFLDLDSQPLADKFHI